jgi:protein-S-isoprenylcysteine O-methyltransferase Ste14
VHLLVVRVEERDLRKRFGQDYDRYCRRVPRWLPRLGAPRASD